MDCNIIHINSEIGIQETHMKEYDQINSNAATLRPYLVYWWWEWRWFMMNVIVAINGRKIAGQLFIWDVYKGKINLSQLIIRLCFEAPTWNEHLFLIEERFWTLRKMSTMKSPIVWILHTQQITITRGIFLLIELSKETNSYAKDNISVSLWGNVRYVLTKYQ